MTVTRRYGGSRRSLSRVLHDITQTLQSADASDARLCRVLELLRWLVPSDECALLEVRPGQPSRILVAPEAPPERHAELAATLDGLYRRLVERERERERARVGGLKEPAERPLAEGGLLAVPLVGYDEVIGILKVRGAAGEYNEGHLRSLVIVGGQLAAYLSMVRAHQEIEEHARQLEAARRGALMANRAKDDYLAAVAHELKDPVASTLAWAHVLVAGGDAAGPARAAAAIERNARALARLVDDMQGLACVAGAELRLDLRAIEPAGTLRAAIEKLRPPGEHEPGAAQSPAWITVEDGPVGPALSSVAASAVDGSPAGWQVAVRLDRITGEVPQLDPGGAATAPAEVSRDAGRPLADLHVLLVDDDGDIRDAFQWVLELYGAAVTAVGSAAAALAAFQRSRPDVLLCDLGMPGENGYDLMRQIAARDAGLPAAAITAFGELADRRRALAAGFRMQLAKPIDAAALVAAVAELAGRRPAAGPPLQDAAPGVGRDDRPTIPSSGRAGGHHA